MIYINDQPAPGQDGVEDADQQPAFFAVSPQKLFVMSLSTLGMYQVYWMYRHWQRVKQREGSDIWPFWRALFGYFFCYVLFRRIHDDCERAGVEGLAAGPLAAGWVVICLLWKLPEPYWLVSHAAILLLLPVQAAACRANEALAPGHARNDGYSGWNIAAIVLGGILWLLAIYGMFFIKN
ncbi:hypothetical protein KIF53_04215 [Chromobacterium subtsugae]|uniref:DUF4234 domain-containing protein n=1 Tax=Chromobacterium subtsugae TaxID=251747 RepID=A0ABS7FA11_9NEIS|nr:MULTISPECIES: hypothetical protein [Chromobacterium]KUM05503.1 hypothetical protein Cv017_08840 [Chromobacterium subtsugae]KZE87835.1 hypothetical protein AWB61_08480 [Chromobacterium sp. F49]MBW7565323.1 hypothetical protein [Chromobacterium subtsugae]MBW8286826.1 hypothetical protein [Chromobacterium subtsugae]WSE90699.1 hypothetical protein U6115_17645 [Chromobacterium subtsugae]